LAARIGGEEFAIVLVETELTRGMEVAERLRVAISSMAIPNAGQITASFGVAECPSCAQTSMDILKAADDLLYQAKGSGRNRVVGQQPVKSNSAVVADVQMERKQSSAT
jgi:diguanylate cyclase (GGDEF)-like protein